MSSHLKLLLVVALGAAALLTTVPRASAARNMELAIQDDSVFVHGLYYNRAKAFARARQLHVTRIRANMGWADTLGRQARYRHTPKHPKFDFFKWDQLVDQANAKGIAVQLALTGPAPRFGSGNRRIGGYKPKARYFRQFVKAAAQHFAGRVDRYSIWNEPNYVSWLGPLSQGPKLYRSLYTTAYKTIKRVDPYAQVLIGETSPYALRRRATAPLSFLRRVACAKRNWRPARHCPTILTDGYAHHPYDFDHAPKFRYPGRDNVTLRTLPKLTRALTLLARYRLMRTPQGGAPYVYLTEYGFFSSGKRRVSRSKQARYLLQGFRMAQRNRRVKEMLQYLLVKPSRTYLFFDTSIASHRGTPYSAFRLLARWAKSASGSGAVAKEPVRSPRPSQGGGGGSSSSPPASGGGTTCPTLPVPSPLPVPVSVPCP